MKQRTVVYLAIAFGWTWLCWISAYFISAQVGYDLNTGVNLFTTIGEYLSGRGKLPNLLFGLAVFGPLLGYLAVGQKKKEDFFISKSKMLWAALVIPFAVTLPTALLSLISLPLGGYEVKALLTTISLYFVSNFFTSGTEELGWRGYLFGSLKATEKNFWDVSWKGGLIWAAWHYPLLFIMYKGLNLVALVPMIIGFTAGIVAMNYLTNVVFAKTRSIPVVMFMHALNNTLSFVVLLFYPQTPYIILVHIMSWVLVAIVEKRFVRVEMD